MDLLLLSIRDFVSENCHAKFGGNWTFRPPFEGFYVYITPTGRRMSHTSHWAEEWAWDNVILLPRQQSASSPLYCTPNIKSNTLLIHPMTACSSSHTRKKALYSAVEPVARFMTYRRNLTPDAAVGLSQKVQERGPTVHLPLQWSVCFALDGSDLSKGRTLFIHSLSIKLTFLLWIVDCYG